MCSLAMPGFQVPRKVVLVTTSHCFNSGMKTYTEVLSPLSIRPGRGFEPAE